MPDLDYEAKGNEKSRWGWRATIWFGVAWISSNVIVYKVAHSQNDLFEGMGDLIFGAIAINALILVAAIALSVLVARRATPIIFASYLVVAVLLPAATLMGALWVMLR